MLKPCECMACMGEAPRDDRCRIAEVPQYLRGLVDEYWVMFGDGRSPLIDAPTWCVQMAGVVEATRAEKRAKERELAEEAELVKKMGRG